MKTTIKKITIYKLSIPLIEPFITSLGPEYSADNVVVTMETENGLIGTGECSPFMPINGESQETCMVVGQYLAKGLKGRDAADISGNHRLMNNIIYGNVSIKSAFDIAMYDIAAQAEGIPLYRFLGGENSHKIQIDYTISLHTIEDMVAHAIKLKKDGFEILKVKLGGDPDTDIARMKAIREAVGEEIAIRIDANQGWNYEGALTALNGMKDLNLQYCEEPIPRWDWLRLPELRKNSPIKIMADESCFDEHDAANLIKFDAADMFNLKMGKSAGIYRAQKIVKLAEAAEMDMQVGGFLESKIGMTAIAHLALSSDRIKYFDLDTPLMFTEDVVTGGMEYGANGRITMPDTPGLGASIAPEILKKLPSVEG